LNTYIQTLVAASMTPTAVTRSTGTSTVVCARIAR